MPAGLFRVLRPIGGRGGLSFLSQHNRERPVGGEAMRARLRSRTFVVGFVALASAIAAAQAVPPPQARVPPPPKGTGILLGQVVDAQDKRPIAGALVTLVGDVPVPQAATSGTDAPRQILTGTARQVHVPERDGRPVSGSRHCGFLHRRGIGQNRPSGVPQSSSSRPTTRSATDCWCGCGRTHPSAAP